MAEDFWIETIDDSRMENFYVSMIGLAMVLILIVFIWHCCGTNEDKHEVLPTKQVVPMKTAVFMHELEPGLVILQSQDGEFFRILQEYDSVKHHYSSPCPGACGSSNQGQGQSTLHYIPQYTRPHYQTHPSAPPVAPINQDLIDIELGTTTHPPPYSS